MSAFTIELPDSLQKSIEEIAAREGYTANQFLAAAASEKLAAVMTVNYLREEAAQGRRVDFERYLQAVPAVPPANNDKLP
jgi:predicted transcriptional regulator